MRRAAADQAVMREVPYANRSPQPRRRLSLGSWPRASDADPVQASALGFGVRLIATFAVAVALVGAGGYMLLEQRLGHARLGGHPAHEMRAAYVASWLLTLLAGAALFYLAGGRRLIREHRIVLQCATRDRLSDLPNLRSFQAELPDAVAAASRHGESLALVLLELDGLESMNRRNGRRAGDAVLRVASGVLRSSRPGDRAYRIGGDDFAMVLTRTDSAGVRALVRRLRRDFAEVGIEASIGTSVLRAGLGREMLRAEARAALDEARRAGANRAVHFEEVRERLPAEARERSDAMLAGSGAGRRRTAG